MFKHIIARTPARSLVDGLTSSHLGKPDYAKALEQHNAYIRALQTCDVDITLLPPDERFPRLGVRRGPGALHLALRHHHPPRRRIAARRDRDHRGNRAALLSGQGRGASRHPARWKPATS